jgi:hypothetical protein
MRASGAKGIFSSRRRLSLESPVAGADTGDSKDWVDDMLADMTRFSL